MNLTLARPTPSPAIPNGLTAFMDDEPDDALPPDAPPCGTEAAYGRHRRHGEPVDDACRAADTRASAARRARWCPDCGYSVTGLNHRVLCGGAS